MKVIHLDIRLRSSFTLPRMPIEDKLDFSNRREDRFINSQKMTP
jgi:hypothetical protein